MSENPDASSVNDRPMTADEVALLKPIAGTGQMPQELHALATRQTLHFTSDVDEPVVRVQRGEQDGSWRVEVETRTIPRPLGGPSFSAIRSPAEFYRQGVDRDAVLSGYRPEWIDVHYQPGEASHSPTLLRRFDGKKLLPLHVFDPDDRKPLVKKSYPWGCIGTVNIGSTGQTGTGVLVGRNVVATAAHLIPWGATASTTCLFIPGDRPPSGSAHGPGVKSYATEVRGVANQDKSAGYDWAVLRLEHALGDLLGYLGYNRYNDDWEDLNVWTVVGYPQPGGARWQSHISINDDDDDSHDGQELESEDADLTDGNSGGPIFAWFNNDPRIIGVVSGGELEYDPPFSTKRVNVFAGGPGLRNLISWARANW